MSSQLRRETPRHAHARDKHGVRLSGPEVEQREIHFSIIEAPEHPRGKKGRFYEVKEIPKEIEAEVEIEEERQKPSAFLVPDAREICPYIRNVTQTGKATYDGTCALTKTPCLGHHAYLIGKDPNCKPYNTIWHPQTAEQAEAIRNASTHDLVAFLDKSEIVRLLKDGI